MAQKQQTKTTKHTIEFSNNTPCCIPPTAQKPAAFKPLIVVRAVGNPLDYQGDSRGGLALSGLAGSL
jgi:hypothetical protein